MAVDLEQVEAGVKEADAPNAIFITQDDMHKISVKWRKVWARRLLGVVE